MDHPPKRQRLFRTGRKSGAIGANSEGGGDGIESHVASTDDDEGVGVRFMKFHAASLVELRPPTHTTRRASTGRIAEARHWGLHRRYAQDSPATPTETTVTETVVVMEQQVIDDAGNTLAVVALSTVSPDPTPQLPTVPTVPPFPSDLTPPAVPPFPTDLTPPPVPAASTTPYFTVSSGFSSFGNSTNTATSTGVSGGTTTSFLNSTTGAFTSLLNSTATSTTSTASTTSTEISTTSSTETTFSSYLPSSGNPQGGGHGTSSPSSTSTPGAGIGSGTGLSIQKPAVIGGLVGGLAGVALILVLALLFIRSKKRKNRRSRGLAPALTGGSASHTRPSGGPVAGGSSTWSLSGGSGGILKRFRPITPQPETALAAPPSEKGFYKVSGRKIPPVLGGGGGDGFGGGYEKETLGSPSDLYGVGSSARFQSLEAIGGSGERVIMRPSPARTPERSHTPTRSPTEASPGGRLPRPFRDGLGRSHPSEDGSKASKFVEDV
ncbi:MAG: hypothetical protein M1840_003546 [Geoglossum simile]|nr:MAG: hypothetical protein M1840_003546 [Geoglossum simile]